MVRYVVRELLGLSEAGKTLHEKTRRIALMVANTLLTYEEIGSRHGVTRQRVGQIAQQFGCATGRKKFQKA